MVIDLGGWEEEKDKRGKVKGVIVSDRARGKTITVEDDVHRRTGEIAASKGVSRGEIVRDAIMGLDTEKTGDIVSAAREQERVEWFDSKSAEHKAERLKRMNDIKSLEKRLAEGGDVSDAEIARTFGQRGKGDRFEVLDRILELREREALIHYLESGGSRSNEGGDAGRSDSTTTTLMNTILNKIIEKEFGGGGEGNSELEQGLSVLAGEVEKLHDTVASLKETSPIAEIEEAMDKVFGFYTKLDDLKEKGENLGFMPKKLEEELDKKTLGKFGKFMSATKDFVDIADKAAGAYRKATGVSPMPDVELPPPE